MTDEARVLVTAPSGSVPLQLPWVTTVGGLFEKARAQLGLSDQEGYELWCADGVTMMNKLERTLQELRDRRICPKREFAIRPSGDDRTS
jgi:hypothetical protein